MEDELPDIDIDDLLRGSHSTEAEKIASMSKTERYNYVMAKGRVVLDDEGTMLIKCPSCIDSVCGLYPMPDPETGRMSMVCSGPTLQRVPEKRRKGGLLFPTYERTGKWFFRSSSAGRYCAYNPERFED